ncbi:hypothetical protein DL96DRAFT_1622921 [Flagelloscypha sp. PMI_526]|nr:hypothetical protein DL96DRAFT_1622921 [Flagelloscypha sp. PMI_526]
MSSTATPDSPTSASTYVAELPVEVWQEILSHLSSSDLWTIRSFNRVAYTLAVRDYYGSIWIGPFRENDFTKKLRRICFVNPTYQSRDLFIVLHVHSDIDLGDRNHHIGHRAETKKDVAQRLRFPKSRDRLFEQVFSNPNLHVETLTVYYDEWILPHTNLIWLSVASTLVHLELQFIGHVVDSLLSLPEKVHCPRLRSFILLMGPGTRSPPFYTKPVCHYTGPWETSWPSTSMHTFLPDLKVFQSMIPPGLVSLGIHWLHPQLSYKPWVVDSSFLHSHAYPDLESLYLSGLSMEKNPSLSQFLLARAPTLKSLIVEDVHDKPGFFRRLPVTDELKDLHLDLPLYTELFQPPSFQSGLKSPVVRRFTNLHRLEIHAMKSPHADGMFMLMTSGVQEIRLSLKTIAFSHLRAALLLLPKVTKLTFSGVSQCSRLMYQLSNHPLWKDLHYSTWHSTAGGRLGPAVRPAMTKALRKDIDRVYAECVSSLKSKDALYSSIETAIKAAEGNVQSTTRLDELVEDHMKVTLELVEGCLVE